MYDTQGTPLLLISCIQIFVHRVSKQDEPIKSINLFVYFFENKKYGCLTASSEVLLSLELEPVELELLLELIVTHESESEE